MGRAMVFRDPELWTKSLLQAARELGMPPRGKKGSAANIRRRNMMPKIQKRAREIYIERQPIPVRDSARLGGGDNAGRLAWVAQHVAATGKKKRS